MTDDEKVDPSKAYELSRPPPNKVFIALDQSWAPWSYENPLPFEATSIQELSELADALVSDTELAPVFRRVGVHGDLSLDERRQIDNFITGFAASRQWARRDDWLLSVAIVLARRIAAGIIEGAYGNEAQEFLREHFFVRENEGGGTLPKFDGYRRVISHEEIVNIAGELLNRPGFVDIARRNTMSGLIHEEYGKVVGPMRFDLEIKYGVLHTYLRAIAAEDLALGVACGEFPSVTSKEASEYIENTRSFYIETLQRNSHYK